MKNNNNNNNNDNNNKNRTSTLLAPDDFVGISFWTQSTALVVITVFCLVLTFKGKNLAAQTGLTVLGVASLAEAIHSFYMRNMWVTTGDTPTVYRYLGWFFSHPLLIILPYFLLKMNGSVPSAELFKLMVPMLIGLLPFFFGEAGYINAGLGFSVMFVAMIYVFYNLFAGSTSKLALKMLSGASLKAFTNTRLLLLIWIALILLGYFFGYLTGGGVDANSLNIIYNVRDILTFVIAFLILYSVAF